jgi:hypothetical protein
MDFMFNYSKSLNISLTPVRWSPPTGQTETEGHRVLDRIHWISKIMNNRLKASALWRSRQKVGI